MAHKNPNYEVTDLSTVNLISQCAFQDNNRLIKMRGNRDGCVLICVGRNWCNFAHDTLVKLIVTLVKGESRSFTSMYRNRVAVAALFNPIMYGVGNTCSCRSGMERSAEVLHFHREARTF